MQIKKYATDHHCLIKTNTYSKRLDTIDALYEAAQKDFAALRREDCEIRIYNDPRWGKQMGMEFSIPSKPIPSDYQHLPQLPMTYG